MLKQGSEAESAQQSRVAAHRSGQARPRRGQPYPVIDLFAGPGGLGEGFASFLGENGEYRFRSAVAIERDEFAHRTLLLRHFVRCFRDGEAPDDYYNFLAGEISEQELFSLHPRQFQHAKNTALRISLGPGSHSTVRELIKGRLNDADRWALVGGPPCQAYSLVGRSRMMSRPDFARDERHTLYLEYLRIIADHRPPIFVMENVKGLLSATIEGKSAISRITGDLSDPGRAFGKKDLDLSYRLYSLSDEEPAGPGVDPRLFVVRAEEHGVPQARHRMFIVGIRSDLKVRPRILKRIKAPSVRDTIGALPPIRSTLSKGSKDPAAWLAEIRVPATEIRRQLNGAPYATDVLQGLKENQAINVTTPLESSSTKYSGRQSRHAALKGLVDSRLSVLTLHEARGHMASDLKRYFYAAVFAQRTGRSPKLADFPELLLPAHKNVGLGQEGKMFSDRFRVQLADQVSTTITSHISKDGHYFIHYDPAQCRSLTVREAARLQTFPDNYFFAGPRTAQYHQVGNAVPPYLARQIAEIVSEVLDSIDGGR